MTAQRLVLNNMFVGVLLTIPWMFRLMGMEFVEGLYASIFFRDPFLLAGGAVFITSLNSFIYLSKMRKDGRRTGGATH